MAQRLNNIFLLSIPHTFFWHGRRFLPCLSLSILLSMCCLLPWVSIWIYSMLFHAHNLCCQKIWCGSYTFLWMGVLFLLGMCLPLSCCLCLYELQLLGIWPLLGGIVLGGGMLLCSYSHRFVSVVLFHLISWHYGCWLFVWRFVMSGTIPWSCFCWKLSVICALLESIRQLV